jgi:hypothetical protein
MRQLQKKNALSHRPKESVKIQNTRIVNNGKGAWYLIKFLRTWGSKPGTSFH